jgi:SpoVK/Ycf46/Vps4 family AAA+-type ATPase
MERQGGDKKQLINNMLHEDPGNVSYSAVGGLNEQIRELRESIELPLMNPELFIRVGIKPPKVEDFFIYHLCFVVFFCCQKGLRLTRSASC